MRSLVILALVVGCGGDKKEAEEPDPVVDDDEDVDDGSEMVSQEVLDGIRRTFERKSRIVGRCFVEGVDAGEIKTTDKGFVTLDATISPSGSASSVEIRDASLKSPAVHACILDMVKDWAFAEPPRPVKTSFTYVLERL